VIGTASRPRLAVFRSNRHVTAQLIDDEAGVTLVAVHDFRMEAPDIEGLSGKVARANAVGQAIAVAAKEKGIESVVFDRAGFKYHGRIAALAEGARKGGLQF
jgi:large subunit ribosomal protein L18